MTSFLGSHYGLEPLSLLIMTIKFQKTPLEEKDLENHSSKQFIKILYKEGEKVFQTEKTKKQKYFFLLKNIFNNLSIVKLVTDITPIFI